MTIASRTQFHIKCLKCESGSSRFQPGEGPSRGLLRDYEPSDGLFWSTNTEAAQRAAGGSSPVPQVEEGAPELLPNHVRRAHHLLTFDHLQNLHS